MGAPSCSCRTRPASRTATAQVRCCGRRAARSPSSIATGYAGERVATATRIGVEIVKKQPDQVGLAVHPKRWVVERLFAWLGRNRRLAKDFEATLASATAFLYAASVLLLTRRLARS